MDKMEQPDGSLRWADIVEKEEKEFRWVDTIEKEEKKFRWADIVEKTEEPRWADIVEKEEAASYVHRCLENPDLGNRGKDPNLENLGFCLGLENKGKDQGFQNPNLENSSKDQGKDKSPVELAPTEVDTSVDTSCPSVSLLSETFVWETPIYEIEVKTKVKTQAIISQAKTSAPSYSDVVSGKNTTYANNSHSEGLPLPLSPCVEKQKHKPRCEDLGLIKKDKYTKTSEIPYSTPLGIQCVQSILMSATQKSLSHFHTAGMSEEAAAYSTPSAADAMNGSYTKNNTSMKFNIRLLDDIFRIRGHLVGSTLKYFIIGFPVSNLTSTFPEHENIWYKVLDKPMFNGNILRLYIDYNKLQQYNLTLNDLASKSFEPDCKWYTSPDFMGMIDIEFHEIQHLSPLLSSLKKIVCGTPDIISCNLLANNTTVVTKGSNIRLASSLLPDIDKRTLTSNHVKDVEKNFGIEAAAAALRSIVKHPILSDFMTRTGAVLEFKKNSKETYRKGLLTSMGFERPKDDLRKALVYKSDCMHTLADAKRNASHIPDTVYEYIMTGNEPKQDFAIINPNLRN